jgi:hypothetical protein
MWVGGVAERPWSASSNEFGEVAIGLWVNNRQVGGQVAHDLFSTVAGPHAAPGTRRFSRWAVRLGTCTARTDFPFAAAASGDALVKKHSSAEIIEKLARADQLATRGLSQNAICSELGISVMTLHRWRARTPDSVDAQMEQRLLLENSRLRNIAANLLLEIRALEETRAEAAPIRSPRVEIPGNKADQKAQRKQAEPTEA